MPKTEAFWNKFNSLQKGKTNPFTGNFTSIQDSVSSMPDTQSSPIPTTGTGLQYLSETSSAPKRIQLNEVEKANVKSVMNGVYNDIVRNMTNVSAIIRYEKPEHEDLYKSLYSNLEDAETNLKKLKADKRPVSIGESKASLSEANEQWRSQLDSVVKNIEDGIKTVEAMLDKHEKSAYSGLLHSLHKHLYLAHTDCKKMGHGLSEAESAAQFEPLIPKELEILVNDADKKMKEALEIVDDESNGGSKFFENLGRYLHAAVKGSNWEKVMQIVNDNS